MNVQCFAIKQSNTRPIHKMITREFYIKLQTQIKDEFPDEFYTYELGVISFQNLILKVRRLIEKETPTEGTKSIFENIEYLLKHNYILQ